MIIAVRSLLIQADDELLLQQASNKQLRTAVGEKYYPNQHVQVLDLSRRCGANGPRFISDSGRNAILEANGKLPKTPLAWIRPQLVSGLDANVAAVIPAETQENTSPSANLVPSTVSQSSFDGSSLSIHPTSVRSSEGPSSAPAWKTAW